MKRFCPQTAATTFAFSSVFILLFDLAASRAWHRRIPAAQGGGEEERSCPPQPGSPADPVQSTRHTVKGTVTPDGKIKLDYSQ